MCQHVWDIPTSHDQPTITGTCKVCGATEEMVNHLEVKGHITLPRDIMPSVRVRQDAGLSLSNVPRHSRPQSRKGEIC